MFHCTDGSRLTCRFDLPHDIAYTRLMSMPPASIRWPVRVTKQAESDNLEQLCLQDLYRCLKRRWYKPNTLRLKTRYDDIWTWNLKGWTFAARMKRLPVTLFACSGGEYSPWRISFVPRYHHTAFVSLTLVRWLTLKTVEAMVTHSPFEWAASNPPVPRIRRRSNGCVVHLCNNVTLLHCIGDTHKV